MRTAVCYYSRHHGNTRKVLEAMARGDRPDRRHRPPDRPAGGLRLRRLRLRRLLWEVPHQRLTRRPAVSAPWQACVLRLHLRGRHGTEHPGAEGAGRGAGLRRAGDLRLQGAQSRTGASAGTCMSSACGAAGACWPSTATAATPLSAGMCPLSSGRTSPASSAQAWPTASPT